MTDKDSIQFELSKSKTDSVLHKRALVLAQRRIGKSERISSRFALVFSLGKERYALELSKLKEVLPFTDYTPVPTSDKIICGVINVRGELHSVLDLSRLMELAPPEAGENAYVIILKENGIGLKVNQLDQIFSYKDNETTEIQNSGDNASARFSQSILNEGIIMLDENKILSHPILSGQVPK